MAKIIFLDIDGPMIPYRCVYLPKQTPIMSLFDPVAVAMLNELCEEYGWKIVLHTSWVCIMGGKETYKHCIKQGINAEHFHEDAWCDERENWRYTRVARWLDKHKDEVEDYWILDDEPYQEDIYNFPHPEGMSLKHILISYYDGFLIEHFDKIRGKIKIVENTEGDSEL